jgi:hypothetical protein
MYAFQHVEKFHWPSAVYVTVIFAILSFLFFRHLNRIKNAFSPSEKGTFIGTHRFIFSEAGIASEGNGYKGFYSWSIISNVVQDNGVIMLFIDTANAFIFPEHKIDNPSGLYNYAKECNKQLNTDSGADSPTPVG